MEPFKSHEKLGIIAGGGAMPLAVAQAALDSGQDVHIIGIRGEAEERIAQYPHSWMKWGEIGRMFKILKNEACKDVVIIGSVRRPDLSQVRFDLGGIKSLPFILSLTIGGDDTILTSIVKFFERKGFRVRGAHEIAPSLVAPLGVLGRHQPDQQNKEDIELACKIISALGKFDVGQAAVVTKGHVLAVEAAEGTDAMLRRSAGLGQWGSKTRGARAGVLVKSPKPEQEERIDMPAIGPRTVELAAEAGLAGIAVTAGNVLLVDRSELISAADAHDLFVIGIDRPAQKINAPNSPE